MSALTRSRRPGQSLPSARAENSGRCATSEAGELVLPDGTAWVPALLGAASARAAAGGAPYVYSAAAEAKRSDPDGRSRKWVLPVLLLQVAGLKLAEWVIRRDPDYS